MHALLPSSSLLMPISSLDTRSQAEYFPSKAEKRRSSGRFQQQIPSASPSQHSGLDTNTGHPSEPAINTHTYELRGMNRSLGRKSPVTTQHNVSSNNAEPSSEHPSAHSVNRPRPDSSLSANHRPSNRMPACGDSTPLRRRSSYGRFDDYSDGARSRSGWSQARNSSSQGAPAYDSAALDSTPRRNSDDFPPPPRCQHTSGASSGQRSGNVPFTARWLDGIPDHVPNAGINSPGRQRKSTCKAVCFYIAMALIAFALVGFLKWYFPLCSPTAVERPEHSTYSHSEISAKLAALKDAFNIQNELSEVPKNVKNAATQLTGAYTDYCPIPHQIIPGQFANGPWRGEIYALDAVSCGTVRELIRDIEKTEYSTDEIQAKLSAGVLADMILVESLRAKFQPSLPSSPQHTPQMDEHTGQPLLLPGPFNARQIELVIQVSDVVTTTLAGRRSEWEKMRYEARQGESLLANLALQCNLAQKQLQAQEERLNKFCGGTHRQGTGKERFHNTLGWLSLSIFFRDTSSKLEYCRQTRSHSTAMAKAVVHTSENIHLQEAMFKLSAGFFSEMQGLWQALRTDVGGAEKQELLERLRHRGQEEDDADAQEAAEQLERFVEVDFLRALGQAMRVEENLRLRRENFAKNVKEKKLQRMEIAGRGQRMMEL